MNVTSNNTGAASKPKVNPVPGIAPTAETEPEVAQTEGETSCRPNENVKGKENPPDAPSKETALHDARDEEMGINVDVKLEIHECPDNSLTCLIEYQVVKLARLFVAKVLRKSRQNPCCTQPLA